MCYLQCGVLVRYYQYLYSMVSTVYLFALVGRSSFVVYVNLAVYIALCAVHTCLTLTLNRVRLQYVCIRVQNELVLSCRYEVACCS